MLVKNLSKESLERSVKMIIDENTNVYVRIDSDEELKSFCNFINKHYPNKFHWSSDNPQESINTEYIYKYYSLRGTLYVGKNYAFYQTRSYHNVGEIHPGVGVDAVVVSVYDIVGDNNKPTIPNWLKC